MRPAVWNVQCFNGSNLGVLCNPHRRANRQLHDVDFFATLFEIYMMDTLLRRADRKNCSLKNMTSQEVCEIQ